MSIGVRELWLFVRLSRPIFLVGGALLYGLGAAIASYLGRSVDVILFIFGQGMITSIQLMAHYLNEYYDAASDADNEQRTLFSGGSGALGSDGLPRQVALYAAVASLVVAATLASVLLFRSAVPLSAWFVLGFIFLGAFFYSSPPVRLITSGYGELSTSLLVAGLLPTFAFTLQTGELHRLLLMSTTPLIALHFAMMLTFELPDFASDLKHDKRTLMIRLGWATAMRLHDFAILFAILTFAIAFYFGLPRRVSLGALIALPLALAQIWQMDRLRRGFPARWRTLSFSASGLFALSSYLMLTGYLLS